MGDVGALGSRRRPLSSVAELAVSLSNVERTLPVVSWPTTIANPQRTRNVSADEMIARRQRMEKRPSTARSGQARSTYPAPRIVWSRRGSPPDSSLRRRFETNTSIVFVVANGS